MVPSQADPIAMIFVLGIERSATTWMSNILDHHSKTDVYLEPLSQFNSRFNRWPDRFSKLQNLEQKASYFIEEFEILKNHRSFLFTRLIDAPLAWRMDLKWAQFLVQKKLASNSVKDFLELNFHKKDRHISISKQQPLQTVIKEVRLNFNAALIPKLNRRAKVIVVIREPASCIRSILQLIEQGDLIELTSDLKQRYGKISPQTVCKYWVDSYLTLIETLENQHIYYEVVNHLEILKYADEVVRDVLDFLDLQFTPGVKNYLQWSNQSGAGKHRTRRSREELLTQIQRDRKEIYPDVKRELEQIQRHPILKQFWSGS